MSETRGCLTNLVSDTARKVHVSLKKRWKTDFVGETSTFLPTEDGESQAFKKNGFTGINRGAKASVFDRGGPL